MLTNKPNFEDVVIGAILLEKDAIDKVPFLEARMFSDDRHRAIMRAILHLQKHYKPIDMRTVNATLVAMKESETVGGLFYLMDLTSKLSSSANLVHYAHELVKEWKLREVARIGDRQVAVSKEVGVEPDDLITKTIHYLEDLQGGKGGTRKKLLDSAQVALDNAELAGKGNNGNFFTINLHGFHEYAMVPGNLVVLAARPAMGKTAFAMMLALQWAASGHPVLINSLEMTGEELAARDMASSVGLSGFRMMTGRGIEDYQYSDMAIRANRYKGIETCTVNEISAMRAEMRGFRRDNKIHPTTPIVLIYDYIQLGKSTGGNREQEVSNISRALKHLAGEENALVIALSQLSRAVETRGGDKKPILSDLRESGSIEQDANMVMFLYRPEYYGLDKYENGESTANICEVIFSKTRMGAPGGAKKATFKDGMFSSYIEGGYRDFTKSAAEVEREVDENETRAPL